MTYRIFWRWYFRALIVLLVWGALALWSQAHQPSFITFSDGGVWDGF